MEQPSPSPRSPRPGPQKATLSPHILVIVALITALTMGVIFAIYQLYYNQSDTIASVIRLDVNPSIQIEVNSKKKILSTVSLNQDGGSLLAGLNLRDLSLEEAMTALGEALISQGFLGHATASALISVEDENQSRGEKLAEESQGYLQAVLDQRQIPSQLVSLAFSRGIYTQEALNYDVSPGKIALLETYSQELDDYERTYLLGLPLCELFDFVQNQTELFHPIGIEKAEQLAKLAALLTDRDNFLLDMDIRLSDGIPYYGVMIYTNSYLYDIKVEATVGNIISNHRNPFQDTLPGLTTHQARDIALGEMLQTESQVGNLVLSLDWSRGRLIYDISADSAENRHRIQVSASSGTLYQHSIESLNQLSETGTPGSNSDDLGMEIIWQIALTHSGVQENQITDRQEEKKSLDGRIVYVISFQTLEHQYRYTILGDGTLFASHSDLTVEEEEVPTLLSQEEAKELIRDFSGLTALSDDAIQATLVEYQEETAYHLIYEHQEIQHSYVLSATTGQILSQESRDLSTGQIGQVQAKNIAIAHARVSEELCKNLSATLNEEETQYQISFAFGSTLYRYQIDAITGEIIEVLRESYGQDAQREEDYQLDTDSFQSLFDHFGADFWG